DHTEDVQPRADTTGPLDIVANNHVSDDRWDRSHRAISADFAGPHHGADGDDGAAGHGDDPVPDVVHPVRAVGVGLAALVHQPHPPADAAVLVQDRPLDVGV